jgi:hypothetical protein
VDAGVPRVPARPLARCASAARGARGRAFRACFRAREQLRSRLARHAAAIRDATAGRAAGRRERWRGAIEGRDVEVRRIVDQLKSGSGCASTLHEPNIFCCLYYELPYTV